MNKVSKNFRFYIIAWAILLVLFNLIAFLVPGMIAGADAFDASFRVGYAFITLAFG